MCVGSGDGEKEAQFIISFNSIPGKSILGKIEQGHSALSQSAPFFLQTAVFQRGVAYLSFLPQLRLNCKKFNDFYSSIPFPPFLPSNPQFLLVTITNTSQPDSPPLPDSAVTFSLNNSTLSPRQEQKCF